MFTLSLFLLCCFSNSSTSYVGFWVNSFTASFWLLIAIYDCLLKDSRCIASLTLLDLSSSLRIVFTTCCLPLTLIYLASTIFYSILAFSLVNSSILPTKCGKLSKLQLTCIIDRLPVLFPWIIVTIPPVCTCLDRFLSITLLDFL